MRTERHKRKENEIRICKEKNEEEKMKLSTGKISSTSIEMRIKSRVGDKKGQ